MTAVPHATRAATGGPTEILFRALAASNRRHEPLLRRVKRAYDAVSPCDVSDEDLRTFLSFLYLCARVLRPVVVVQTGTAIGTSTVAIALALSENGGGRLYTIDPEPSHYLGVNEPVAVARRVVAAAGLGKYVTFVRGYSTLPLDANRIVLNGAPTWRLPAVYRTVRSDLLIVDGDHTFLGCYLDLVYGSAGLSDSGPRTIICHDYLGIREVGDAIRCWRRSRRPRLSRVVPSPCGINFLQL